MNTDAAYRGMGAVLVGAAVAYIASHVGMSGWEISGLVMVTVAGLQMVAGNRFFA